MDGCVESSLADDDVEEASWDVDFAADIFVLGVADRAWRRKRGSGDLFLAGVGRYGDGVSDTSIDLHNDLDGIDSQFRLVPFREHLLVNGEVPSVA